MNALDINLIFLVRGNYMTFSLLSLIPYYQNSGNKDLILKKLPVELLHEIIKICDPKSCLDLRNVSKGMRFAVDTMSHIDLKNMETKRYLFCKDIYIKPFKLSHSEKIELSKSNKTKPKALRYLSKEKSLEIRTNVMNNKNTPKDVAEYLRSTISVYKLSTTYSSGSQNFSRTSRMMMM